MDRFRPLVLVNRFWMMRRRWVIGGLAVAAIGVVLPAAMQMKSHLDVLQAKRAQTAQDRQNLQSLLDKQQAMEAAIRKIEAGRAKVMEAAASDQGVTEEMINYWRRQMYVFGRVKNLNISVIGRAKSPYKGAVRLNVEIASAIPGKPAPRAVLAQTLDFLQLYGYIESFDGAVATIHIQGA